MKSGQKVFLLSILGASLLLSTTIATSQSIAAQDSSAPNGNANTSKANDTIQPKSIDDYFYKMEKDIPGFSGYYYDTDGKLVVYLTDPDGSNKDNVKNILLSNYLDSEDDIKNGIELKKAEYSWQTWLGWKEIISNFAMNGNSGVYQNNLANGSIDDGHKNIRSLDIDEKNQKLVVGLGDVENTKVQKIKDFIKDNGMPERVVQIVRTDKAINEDEITGGTDLAAPNTRCTTGFIAKRNSGATVGVTAGHCEPVPDLAGDQVFTFFGTLIDAGQEIANTNNPGIRSGDSLLFSATPGNFFTFAKIKAGSNVYTVTGKKSFPVVGEFIFKYGRSAGETSGTILQTGLTLFNDAAAPYPRLDNMDTADYFSLNGDSGGPIYKKTGTNVVIYGIHKGTLPGSSTQRMFSPVSSIEADQGTLTVN